MYGLSRKTWAKITLWTSAVGLVGWALIVEVLA